ncbi:hypothetical protein LSH36_541g01039 [Paralvinella palmiformis]|uniref:Selenoprotein S n=1 Tax=Paralvinella palmiformis TaxID=53620 RepID=A0AAD9MVU8_9ANNE|nr:hypothetical protein LSH36_541g01039 [Paralvinella palmiformis]
MEAGDDAPTDGRPSYEEPSMVPENQSHTLNYVYLFATGFLEQYGWYVLITVITILYLYAKLSSYFTRKNLAWNRSTDYAQYDSEEVFRRQEAMDAARRRLQEQHEAMAEKYLEEQKKREEEKRKQKIEEWNRHLEGKGYRSKIKVESETVIHMIQ